MRVRMLLGSLCCLLLPLAPLLADSHRADSGFYVAVRAGGTDTFIRTHYTPTVLQHRIALGLSYRF